VTLRVALLLSLGASLVAGCGAGSDGGTIAAEPTTSDSAERAATSGPAADVPTTTDPATASSTDATATSLSTAVGSAPSSTTTTTTPRGSLVLNGTGDVSLDPGYVGELRTNGWGWAWSGLDGLFLDDDLTLINLECAVSDLGEPVPKEFNFRCDPDALPDARAAGIDVANLANNHSGDFGREALVDSVTQVRAAGIEPVGVGANATEAGAPAIFDVAGWRIAVVGFGGVVPDPSWIATDTRPGMRDGDDTPSMVEAVEAADAQADLVIVVIHWGRELDTVPLADDIPRAEALVAAGADVIFGSHSHRLQPLEFIDGKPVFWSLGNFVWPRNSAASADSAVGHVQIAPDGTTTACMLDATINPGGHPTLDDPTRRTC
jgi:poly-gamma-glutamate capsule biosynthesis protein CapA/YwtB (metallophosphatase superfamily)